MGIRERNEKEKQKAVEALSKYFEENFKVFANKLTKRVVDWSSSIKVKEICKNINLYMILSFENEIMNHTDNEERYWVDANGRVEHIGRDKDRKKKLIKPKVHREVNDIKNTQTGFSEYFGDLRQVEWIVTYSESKNVHKFVACVILNLLKHSIKDLHILENGEEELQKYIGENDFIDVYIKEMCECYTKIPDVKLITAILQEPYEGRKSCGTIHFVNDSEKIKKESTPIARFTEDNLFKVYVDFKDVQSIRKLLETCSDMGNSLVVLPCGQKGVVSGVVSNNLELEAEEGFSIVFYGNQWEINCGEEVLLRYQNGSYHINFEDEKNKIKKKCQEVGIEYAIFEKLFQMLVEKAVHGALVIIAEDAQSEVHRLCEKYGRGVAIKKLAVGNKDEDKVCQLILGLTYVDGAVFFDYDGNCYGFSVILDGVARVQGEKSRGSRYNSAINYIVNSDENKKRCAVVRSEDREKELTIISAQQALEKYSI